MPYTVFPTLPRMDDASPLFVDTSYLLALANTRDQWHAAAVRWQANLADSGRLSVTTGFVLLEMANSLAAVRSRRLAVGIVDPMRSGDRVEIVPPDHLFDAALKLYRDRPDKEWSLTDCGSFVVMGERRLTSALSSDHHLRQAGFVPLLQGEPNP